MSYPIAGNQNFTKVENLAGQLSVANITDANVDDLQANHLQVKVASSLVPVLLPENTEVKVLRAVAPLKFATLNGGTTDLPMVLANNTATPTSGTDPTNARVPEGATVVAVEFDNNGVTVVGCDDLNISLGGFNVTPTTPLVVGTKASVINDGGLVHCATAQAGADANKLGVGTGEKFQGVVVTQDNYLGLRNIGAANTAGALKVNVYYLD